MRCFNKIPTWGIVKECPPPPQVMGGSALEKEILLKGGRRSLPIV